MTTARCREYGHEHYALPCRACRSEALEAEPADTPITALTPEQAERNAMWARTCRAALNADRTTTTEEKP